MQQSHTGSRLSNNSYRSDRKPVRNIENHYHRNHQQNNATIDANEEQSSKKNQRCLIIGIILATIALIALGIGFGVTVLTKKSSKKNGQQSSLSSTKSTKPSILGKTPLKTDPVAKKIPLCTSYVAFDTEDHKNGSTKYQKLALGFFDPADRAKWPSSSPGNPDALPLYPENEFSQNKWSEFDSPESADNPYTGLEIFVNYCQGENDRGDNPYDKSWEDITFQKGLFGNSTGGFCDEYWEPLRKPWEKKTFHVNPATQLVSLRPNGNNTDDVEWTWPDHSGGEGISGNHIMHMPLMGRPNEGATYEDRSIRFNTTDPRDGSQRETTMVCTAFYFGGVGETLVIGSGKDLGELSKMELAKVTIDDDEDYTGLKTVFDFTLPTKSPAKMECEGHGLHSGNKCTFSCPSEHLKVDCTGNPGTATGGESDYELNCACVPQ